MRLKGMSEEFSHGQRRIQCRMGVLIHDLDLAAELFQDPRETRGPHRPRPDEPAFEPSLLLPRGMPSRIPSFVKVNFVAGSNSPCRRTRPDGSGVPRYTRIPTSTPKSRRPHGNEAKA